MALKIAFCSVVWSKTVSLLVDGRARSSSHLILESFFTAPPTVTFFTILTNGHECHDPVYHDPLATDVRPRASWALAPWAGEVPIVGTPKPHLEMS